MCYLLFKLWYKCTKYKVKKIIIGVFNSTQPKFNSYSLNNLSNLIKLSQIRISKNEDKLHFGWAYWIRGRVGLGLKWNVF